MKKNHKLSALLIATLLTGCNSLNSPSTTTAPPADPGKTEQPAATHDAFKGTYNGVLPCADCDGLQTTLILDGANNYSIQSQKLGKNQQVNDAHGIYRVTTDKQYLQLDNNASNLTFFVGQGFLEVRLPDGSKGQRPLPDENYRLKRQ
ncbi:MAG: copper resistance protein NlpE N-terminal domain-containing protein [Cardiobacteriaceae bacterium]|nr:copper resistance protein NlpE N-terminal domain-containing protein [Cardiobacteriaceae bacterium]